LHPSDVAFSIALKQQLTSHTNIINSQALSDAINLLYAQHTAQPAAKRKRPSIPDLTATPSYQQAKSVLEGCFHRMPDLKSLNKRKAATYGTMAGFTIASYALGISWGVMSILVSIGISIVLPPAGWIALGVACLTLGALLGYSIGVNKQKNMQRRLNNDNIKSYNKTLSHAKRSLKFTVLSTHPTAPLVHLTHYRTDHKLQATVKRTPASKFARPKLALHDQNHGLFKRRHQRPDFKFDPHPAYRMAHKK
jgi:hypothetical protein